jgi:16S rRNA (cytosine1402-N4)-methyltransferase
MDFKRYHQPVLVQSLLDHFNLTNHSTVLDGTMGFAGHADAILSEHPSIRYIGFDKDLAAISIAKQRCARYSNVQIIHSPFSSMFQHLDGESVPTHILLDLGVSSFQIDQSHRGFTFQKNEPLDMRMDTNAKLSAYHVLHDYTQDALVALFETQGDIRAPHKFVGEILAKRNGNHLNTTFDLVDCVKRGFFLRSRRQFIAMCTKVFQAIRVEVNGEMKELKEFLDQVLKYSGVIVAIITFQPNEDKTLKAFIKDHGLIRITKKPLQSSYQECKKNPRERSAKLRIFQIQ